MKQRGEYTLRWEITYDAKARIDSEAKITSWMLWFRSTTEGNIESGTH